MFIIAPNGTFDHILGSGNIEFSPTVFQPAETLSAEQRVLFGVYELVETPQPTYDPAIQIVREVDPALVNGLWAKQWQVVALTADEQAAIALQASSALTSAIVAAAQARLDMFAKTRDYDGILSACTYVMSSVPKFSTEGQYCVTARDQTWAALYELLAEIQAGMHPIPTGFADVEPLLPILAWPA